MSAEKLKIRRVLDALLNHRWSALLPVLLFAAVLALFALFGPAQGKITLLMTGLITGGAAFFGVFLVLGFQTRRTKDAAFAATCGPFLNAFTLLVLLVMGWSTLCITVQFLLDMGSFSPMNTVSPMALGAVTWVHQLRKD